MGWSSQALGWWLLELLEELPRSKTQTQTVNWWGSALSAVVLPTHEFTSQPRTRTVVFHRRVAMVVVLHCVFKMFQHQIDIDSGTLRKSFSVA